MTSPSSPEGSGLIERLTQAKTWQREDLTALCFEAASALSAYEGVVRRWVDARKAVLTLTDKLPSDDFKQAWLELGDAEWALTALEQSGEGLGSSVASRAGEGLRPFASENQQILGKEDQ